MKKTKGSKAIGKNEKRLKKEKMKQIELANKMLIPVGKATNKSLGLISFDPSGVFRFNKNRWVKVFQVNRFFDSEQGMTWEQILQELQSRIRCTSEIEGIIKRKIITLTLNGEIYEEVRKIFAKDEAMLKNLMDIKPLSIDEVMTIVAWEKDVSPFSYASMVRGKRDWKKETFPKVKEENMKLMIDELYGECIFALQIPLHLTVRLNKRLEEIGCQVCITHDYQKVSREDQADFVRALEQRYNKRVSDKECSEFVNVSVQLMFLCDSDDARKIVEKTIFSMFSNVGFVMSPSIGCQKESAESILSFGLLDKTIMRNVGKEDLKIIELQGGTDESHENKV